MQRRLGPIVSGGYVRRITSIVAWATYIFGYHIWKGGKEDGGREGGGEEED